MSRDYAKRRRIHQRQKPKKKLFLIWILALILGSSFIAGLLMLGKYHRTIRKLAKKSPIEKITTAASNYNLAKVTPEVEKNTTPKFDFYNILEQKKPNKLEAIYELEIAVVNEFTIADNLKARLALLGLVASTTPIYKQGTQKFQVTVGPYDNQAGALADQQKLKQNDIKSSIKKINFRN